MDCGRPPTPSEGSDRPHRWPCPAVSAGDHPAAGGHRVGRRTPGGPPHAATPTRWWSMREHTPAPPGIQRLRPIGPRAQPRRTPRLGEGLSLQQAGIARLAVLPADALPPNAAIRAVMEGVRLERLARGDGTARTAHDMPLEGNLDLHRFSLTELRALASLATRAARPPMRWRCKCWSRASWRRAPKGRSPSGPWRIGCCAASRCS